MSLWERIMKDELVANSIALELRWVKLNYGSYSSLDLKRTFSVFILSMGMADHHGNANNNLKSDACNLRMPAFSKLEL
jgi:hypothetical protein